MVLAQGGLGLEEGPGDTVMANMPWWAEGDVITEGATNWSRAPAGSCVIPAGRNRSATGWCNACIQRIPAYRREHGRDGLVRIHGHLDRLADARSGTRPPGEGVTESFGCCQRYDSAVGILAAGCVRR